MFDERRVAQMAAYFLWKAGGRMPHLKLMKLLYLADRESLNRFESPMTGDRMVSMPHGPVLSQTLDLINGLGRQDGSDWSAWIADRENYEVSLSCSDADAQPQNLKALSTSDISILDDIWREFGHMTKYQIRDWTHEHCREWEDPKGSANPIQYRDVMVALGRDLDTARAIHDDIEASRMAYQVLDTL